MNVFSFLWRLSNLTSTPLKSSWGIIMNGMRTYIVAAELNADEMFSPIRLARQEELNNIIQYVIVIPLIPSIRFPAITNDNV